MIKISIKNFLLATFSIFCVGVVDVWGGDGVVPPREQQQAVQEPGVPQPNGVPGRQYAGGAANQGLCNGDPGLASLEGQRIAPLAALIEKINLEDLRLNQVGGDDPWNPVNLQRYLSLLQRKTLRSEVEASILVDLSKYFAAGSVVEDYSMRIGHNRRSGDDPTEIVAEVFCGGIFGHMPLGFRKNATNIGIAVTAFIVLSVLKELFTSPFKTFFSNVTTNPFARLLKHITKDADAERLGDLAENIKMFATEVRTFLRDIKTLCASIDNGMKARQAGLIDIQGGNSSLPVVGDGVGQVAAAVSLLEGFKMTCESFLEDIEFELVGQDKKSGFLNSSASKANKFKRQVSRLKALKHELEECETCVSQITSVSDVTDQKKMSVLNGRVMSIESLAMLLLKSLVPFGVVRMAQQSSGGRVGGFGGGGQYAGQY